MAEEGAEAIAVEEAKKQPAWKKQKTPAPIDELSLVPPNSGWKKGQAELAKREGERERDFSSLQR